MASQNRITKLILAGLLITALTTATAAASIEAAGGNDIVWQNSEWNVDEVQAQCSDSIQSIQVNGTEVYSGSDNVTVLKSSHILDEIEFSAPATLDFVLNCENDESPKSLNLDLAKFGLSIDTEGVGFVGSVMRDQEGSLGNRKELSYDSDIQASDFSLNDLEASDFAFSSILELGSERVAFTENGVTFYPYVESYPEYPGDEIVLNVTDESTGLSYTKKVFGQDGSDFFVHKWKANKVGDNNPGRKMNYEEVAGGSYVYFLDMKYADQSDLPESDAERLGDSNFWLTVKEKTRDGYSLPEDQKNGFGGKDYQNMEIMNQEAPGGNSDANYKVEVDDFSKLDSLKAGKYNFILKIEYDAGKPENEKKWIRIDETTIEKSTEFSGIVLNAGQSGVKTLMELTYGNTKKTVESGNDGQYSVEISEEEFDSMNLKFFDTTKDTGNAPDSELNLNKVTLDNPDLGPGSSAINFNYWNDPETDIEGLRPVNMMAIKFGYPVGSVTGLDMKFDSGELDPKDMKVYECDAWNFQGQECMSSWSDLDVSSDDIDFASWRVNLGNVSLYDAGDEDILMSSYVLGTSSKISLQDSISLESSSIKHSGNLKASGVLVSDNGDRVGDANVTLSLVQGDEVVKSWSENSDSTGTFEFSETVDVEAGNYQLRVEASKSPYQSFEMTSDKTLEVYYEKGISLDAPTSVDVVQGNKSRLELEVSNTGQQSIENIELEVSGLKDKFYTVSSDVGSLGPKDSQSVEIVLDLPSDYCSLPCGNPPQLDFSVTGESGDEEVSDSLMTSIVLSREPSKDQSSGGSTEEQESTRDSSSETDNSGPESGSSPISDVQEMTGDFVEKQGELNIALGLIFIFTMMLALSVKKKKNGDSDRRSLDDGRGGGRPSLQRPPIKSGDVHEVEAKEKESDEEEKDEGSQEESEDTEEVDEGSDDSGEGFECSVCGEEFESESGRDLHEEAVH